jgi:lipoate---protein ligase
MKATSGPLSADYKVPGGKLLRVQLTLDATQAPPAIVTLRIHGDFFMHPEEAIEELEARLTGLPCEVEALRPAVQAFFDSDVQVLGADVDGVVHAILAAGGGDRG